MTKFKKFEEFDTSVADSGIWIKHYDRAGNYYGKFLCALMHDDSPKVQTFQQRNRRAANQGEVLGEEEAFDRTRKMFITCSLLDWELEDAEGKSVPYDTQTAHEYFSQPEMKRVLIALFSQAMDVMNYQPDVELPEGNS